MQRPQSTTTFAITELQYFLEKYFVFNNVEINTYYHQNFDIKFLLCISPPNPEKYPLDETEKTHLETYCHT
jgi:hypothetical protein